MAGPSNPGAGSDVGLTAAASPLDWSLLPAACALALTAHQGGPEAIHAAPDPDPGAKQQVPGTIFVGLSGGLDSVVLLSLAVAWRQALAANQATPSPLRVVALHAHHGLQASADAWRQACIDRCAALGVELVTCRLSLTNRTESAARAARYDFFRRQLRPGQCLLLAHHADDQAETLLLRVAQGRSMQGMPISRSLGDGLVVRPLLGQRRDALEAYARKRGLGWAEDPSNAELEADRNFVRHRWLPLAQERWPDLVPKLVGLAARQRQQDDLLESLVAGWDQVPVDHAQLLTGASLLRVWLRSFGETQVTQLALEEFCSQLGARPDKSPSLALGAGELRRHAGAVHYVPDAHKTPLALADHYVITSPGVLRLPHGLLTLSGPNAELQVRFAQSLRSQGAVSSVQSRRWQQVGVPPWRRDSYPQLFAGEHRLGLPVAGVETQLPRGSQPQGDDQRWLVLWQPDRPFTRV